ncbi:MAG: hypothetical protein HKN87_08645 [Saprospiraceae bacterium]|nr:hypothetical protein [Saprospiraceae bacterium]
MLRICGDYILACLVLLPFACQTPEKDFVSPTIQPEESLRGGLTQLLDLGANRPAIHDHSLKQMGEKEDHWLYRLELYLDGGDTIPSYLLKPKGATAPYPIMICLQGHAPGMYVSIGEARTERDVRLIAGGRDIAAQAVAHGWAAITVEQRGFGEQTVGDLECNHVALNHMMAGGSLLGRRVEDISIAIDFITTQGDLNNEMIGIMGNSSGGTTSYFAACMDARIDLAIVSCSFCTYDRSWLKYPHCACGYVPNLLTLADMPELAALISPRHLLIVAGKEDYLADIEGVRDGYSTAKQLYEVEENIRLVEGNGGHQFYPNLAWPIIDHFLESKSFPKS